MTKIRIILVCAVIASAAALATAQGTEQPEARNASPARSPMMLPAPADSTGNVHIEVSIADSVGATPQQKKSVSMLVAEGYMGRVRSQRGSAAILNIDATPRIQKDGRISLQLLLEYRPRETAETVDALSPINEMLTVLLQSGKPLVVTQAADPSSDRKVVVQVTATVLK